jgi:hypothetical protein
VSAWGVHVFLLKQLRRMELQAQINSQVTVPHGSLVQRLAVVSYVSLRLGLCEV